MKQLLRFEVLRYLLVGALNTGFSYCVYALFLWLDMDYRLANFAAFALGIAFSFRTQGALVFEQTAGNRFWRFASAWLLVYLSNIGLIGLLLKTGLDAYAAGAVALPPVIVISYFLQKLWVFNQSRSR